MDFKDVYDEETTAALLREQVRLKSVSYLDHTGSTLYPEGLVKAIGADLGSQLYGNPHALNSSSRLSSEIVEQTREKVLSYFNTDSSKYHLVFTSGATGGLRILAQCFKWSPSSAFAYFAESHTSILGIRQLASIGGAEIIPITKNEIEGVVSSKTPLPVNGGLFAYPAQCNFSGAKLPLTWVNLMKQKGNWSVLLDAASFAATSPLDLSKVQPDFVCLSFYKMFGMPTGLGALLVRQGSESRLQKQYFGGGTVFMALASEKLRHEPRELFHEWFEDGTIDFLSIVQLRIAMEYFKKLIPGGIASIEEHTFNLARYLFCSISALKHYNGNKVAVIYQDNDFKNKETQGPIVNFNLLRADGSFIGFSEVLHICNLFDVHLRTGCFCNPGACQRHLKMSVEELEKQFEAGHVCGDSVDLLGGHPTGSVRASIGYCSTKEDVDKFVSLIKKCFLESMPGAVETQVLTENHQLVEMKDGPKLRRLFLYPVKSCGAQEVQSWPLDNKGLVGDRSWMVTTDALTPLTQKSCPRMCLVEPRLDLQSQILILKFPGQPDISVKYLSKPHSENHDEASKMSKVCGVRVQTQDCGDEVANWLSLSLEISGLRLLQQWSNDQRQQKSGQANLSLANQSQFLLLGLPSLSWLEGQVREKQTAEEISDCVTGDNLLHRFRANLIISGVPAFEEKNWKVIKIGNTTFKNDGPCTRCQMVCIDQSSGEKSVEPLRTIAAAGQGKMQFGVYFSQLLSTSENYLFVGSPIKPLDL